MQSESTSHLSRRSHPKSKTGCRVCKRRKVKCDEGRPSCRNCIKHAVQCDFTHGQTESRVDIQHNSQSPPQLNMLDLELLHNFSIVTHSTLSNDSLLQQLWKITIPKIGLQCDYIMLSTLAVSALHIASYRPAEKALYISKAIFYHQVASRKAMKELGTITSEIPIERAEHLYLFSILTIYVALASPRREYGSLLLGESGCPEWMSLLRGTKSLLVLMGERVHTGPLSRLFVHGQKRWLAMHPEIEPGYQDNLSDNSPFVKLQTWLEESVANRETLKVYLSAVSELRATFRLLEGGWQLDGTDVFVWVWEVADEFLSFLEVPTQEAVAIFAHFCVLLKKLDNQWWLKGWGDHLMSRAYHMLDNQHKLWIQWPIEQIGWVAS
ncbi:hypothetical protein GGI43DRAFT_419517 [Trichoderma evansii]